MTTERKTEEWLRDHIERAAGEVEKWPQWKRNNTMFGECHHRLPHDLCGICSVSLEIK